VELKDRIASIDANLNDLQSGLEACSRAAEILHIDTTKFTDLANRPLLRAVTRHVKDLQAVARDQRMALAELRDTISGLLHELKRSQSAVRPPPAMAADQEP
jgi:hypothetical protein